jgi:hypothetical protein
MYPIEINRIGDLYEEHLSNSYKTESMVSLKTDYIIGVAPDAQVKIYNVFGIRGSTSPSIVLDALNKESYDQSANVITMPEIKGIDDKEKELRKSSISTEKTGTVMIVAVNSNNFLDRNYFSYNGLPVISVGGYRTPYQLAQSI